MTSLRALLFTMAAMVSTSPALANADLAKKYIDQDVYPWAQPGDVRVNCRMVDERELGMG